MRWLGRWIGPLAVSLLAHALAVFVFDRAQPAPAPWPKPLAVEIVHLPPPEPVAETPKDEPAPRRPHGAPPAPAAPPVAHVGPPSVGPPPPDGPRGLPGDAPVAPRLNLVPGAPFAVDVPPPAPEGLSAPKVVAPADLVTSFTREAMGKAKVERGLVHPYYSELGKRLLRTWDADRAVSRTGLKGYSQQFAENSRTFANIWKDRAATFGATGSPLGELQEDRRGPLQTGPAGLPSPSARYAMNRQLREQFRATRRALIRVTQAPDGKLLLVELVSPSNDDQVDKEALEDIRAAASKFPVPPPEVLGRREQLVSLWQFELIVSISPPVPTFSFEFDAALGFIDARLPLDRRIYKRVRLVSVD